MLRPLALSAVLLAAGPVLAAPPAPAPVQAEPYGPEITVHFAGGTLGDYVEAVRKACGVPVNVVVDARALAFRMSELHLSAVALSAALEAIPTAVLNDPSQVVVSRIRDQNGGVVFTVQFAGDKDAQSETLVLNLNPLQEDAPADDKASRPTTVDPEFLVKTCRKALDAGFPGMPEATLAYDAGSGLLFVRGTPEQVKTVKAVAVALGAVAQEPQCFTASLRNLINDFDRRKGQTEVTLSDGDVVAAIKKAVAAAGNQLAVVQYDKDAQLLTVKGTARQVELAKLALTEIEEGIAKERTYRHSIP